MEIQIGLGPYITTSAQGVDVQNLMEIDSAAMNLRMREKRVFGCFLVNICLRRYDTVDIVSSYMLSKK